MNSTVRVAAGLTTYLCAACVILSPALAEEYSWQVSADYVDASAGSAASALHRLLRATYHLSPVEDSAGPYELAPFLNRSSYVAVGTTRTTLRDEAYLQSATDPGAGNHSLTIVPVGVNNAFSAFPLESGFSTSDYAVDGRYVWPASGWYAGARAERGDGDAAPLLSFFRTTSDSRRTGLFAGRYFGPRTAVEVHLESESMTEDVRMNVPGFDPLFSLPSISNVGDVGTIVDYEFGLVTGVDRDTAAVLIRHVGNLAGSTFEFSARLRSTRSEARFALQRPPELVGWSDPADWPVGQPAGPFPAFAPVETHPAEDERDVRVSGALFPVESLGIRLTVSTSDHDAYGTTDRVGLSARWFFVRNAAVEIELTRSRYVRSYLPDSRTTDAVGVRLLGRF